MLIYIKHINHDKFPLGISDHKFHQNCLVSPAHCAAAAGSFPLKKIKVILTIY